MNKRKRMCWFYADVLLSLFIIIFQNRSVSSKSCLASMPTLQLVDECPKTKEEWNKRSGIKRCDMLAGTSECSSFAYHCLLNQNGNATVEVCAPTWFLSGFCAIYNTDEFRVVDDFSFDCNSTKIKKEDRCPSRYISTETYKYQICYRKREQTTQASDRIHQSNMENRSVTSIWTIVFIVLFILALIASIIQGVFLYRVGCRKLRNTEEKCKTNKPRQEDPFHDLKQGDTHQNQFEEDVLGNDEIPLLDVSTHTNPKAKNDHEIAKIEREEERRGVEEGKHVKKILEKFGGIKETGDQGKESKGNKEMVPRQQQKPDISGGKSAKGDQGKDSKGNNEVVPRQQTNPVTNGTSLELETSAEGNNLRSKREDNLGDLEKNEMQPDEVNQSTSTDIKEENTDLEKNEMQQDEVIQSTSTDIKEESTDTTNIPSNNPSDEKCSSQE